MPHDTTTNQQHHSPHRANEPAVAAAHLLTEPPAVGRPEAIPISGCRVIVTEHRTRGLVNRDDITYISPRQSEQQARRLIMLLTDATVAADDTGPWRRPPAGGRRIIELEHPR